MLNFSQSREKFVFYPGHKSILNHIAQFALRNRKINLKKKKRKKVVITFIDKHHSVFTGVLNTVDIAKKIIRYKL